jgi:hypothetical protein
MRIALDTYSYRSGEIHLNTRPVIKREIEDILLTQNPQFNKWSRDEYDQIVRADFLLRGWESQPSVLDKRGNPVTLMDFRKERVGIKLGIKPDASIPAIFRLQNAFQSTTAKIDLGIYITATAEFQRFMKKEYNKVWTGPSFNSIAKQFPSLGRLVDLPICVMALDIVRSSVRTIDIEGTPPSVLKKLILTYLEWKYDRKIEKQVRMIGKKVNEEFDGIVRLPEKDIILAIELSRSGGNFPTKLFSDNIRGFVESVREYQQITRPETCLRFVLMGDFSSSIIQGIFNDSGIAYGWSSNMEVEYEVHQLSEFEEFLTMKRESMTRA